MSKQKRHLVAIMFTDIVGYSAMMGENEDHAFEILKKSRSIHQASIKKYGGQWLKEMGDGVLAKFDSAYDSVKCALEIQKLANADLKGLIRIGIHLGDVIFDNDDVFGDGVNLAARIQAIADPGGIYISESIQKSLRARSDIQCLYLGEVQLKNIDYPVKIYALQGVGLPIPIPNKIKKLSYSNRGPTKRTFFYLILLLVLTVSGWWTMKKIMPYKVHEIESIAVLPLDNFTGDDDLEYLLAGLHDNLITTISKISSLRIISKTSSARFKGQNKSATEIAEDLDVDAILESSLVSFGDSVRLNVQLIRVFPKEEHLWAEIFDRPVRNIFSLFNEVAQTIANEVNLTLSPQEKNLLTNAKEIDPEVLQSYLKGRFYWDKLTPNDLQTALEYYQLAVQKDPEFAPAYAGIAAVWSGRRQMGITPHKEAYREAKKAIDKALELDSTDTEVLYNYAISIGWMNWEWKKTEAAYEKILKLNPNHANAHAYYSNLLMVFKKTDKAMTHMKIALQLDPYNDVIQGLYAINLSFLRRCDEVFNLFSEKAAVHPLSRNAIHNCYVSEGMYEEALKVKKVMFLPKNDEELINTLEKGYQEGGFLVAMRRVAELREERAKQKYIPPMSIAIPFAQAGQKEKTLDFLEKALTEHAANIPYITIFPMFDFLRDEPRFKEILFKMDLLEY